MNRRKFLRLSILAGASLWASHHGIGEANPVKTIVLGKSKIVMKHGSVVGAQVDRVIRDIVWKNSKFDENANLFSVVTGDTEKIVPYMEGRLSRLLMEYANATIIGLFPSYALRKDGDYYAFDGEGEFRFKIDPSKIDYASVHFNADKSKAVLLDTHGFNTIAAEALRINKIRKLDLVIACMDLPSKAQAALFLAQHGINCYGPCDRYAYNLIGYRSIIPRGGTIIGSAPVRTYRGGAVIGDQAVAFDIYENITVQYTEKGYPDQYCDTPARYFNALSEKFALNLNLIQVDASIGETAKVVEVAEKNGSKVIGVRIYNEQDATPVVKWLGKDKKNRAILFHSAPYQPGFDMFLKFPEQTSFGDLSPLLL